MFRLIGKRQKSNESAARKITFTLIFTLLFFSLGFAQNGINYKAVIKDTNGNVVTNQNITLQFTILESATNVYQETHSPTTDANGIAIVNIGEGTPVSGTFSAINWGSDGHFLKVEIDIAGGTTYVDMGTTEFKTVPYALNVTGLEAIDQGKGIGWRLKGRDHSKHGPIGLNGVDFTYSEGSDLLNGAFGQSSTAFGQSTKAVGRWSTAIGYYTLAYGDYSFSTGNSSISLGEFSIAMGNYAQAYGDHASAIGNNTDADAAYSTSIGSYNVGGGHRTDWVATESLFEIGNGTSSSNRSNAITVLKNGETFIAGPLNINDNTSASAALRVNGAEAIWYNGTYFSWGFSGTANYFQDNVGIGITNPNAQLDVNGNIEYTGTIIDVSDERLKENFKPIESPLSKLELITGLSYNMIYDVTKKREYGVVAQEVQKVFPEMVSEVDPENGYLGVSYIQLIPVLLEAIKEQQGIIDNEKNINAKQTMQIEALLSRLENLEGKQLN